MSGTHVAWLGLGANLGDPAGQIAAAVRELARRPGISSVRTSRLWHGPYQGPRGPQPDYFNLCARVETTLAPRELLDLGHEIERGAGRVQPTHQEPRVLDIDLLLFDTLCLDEPGLTVPHPRLRERRFVLEPLADLDPDLALPPDGTRVEELLRRPRIAAQPLEVVSTPGRSGPAGSDGSGT